MEERREKRMRRRFTEEFKLGSRGVIQEARLSFSCGP